MIDRMADDEPHNCFVWGAVFLKHAIQGNKRRALEAVTPELTAFAQWDEFMPWLLAAGHALIDEKEEAIDWLEFAASRGFSHYPFLSEHDPFIENIRAEPRFQRLLAKVKEQWEQFEV